MLPRYRWAMLLSLAVYVACGDSATDVTDPSTEPPPGPASVSSLAVSPETATLTVGDTLRLTAIAKDANGSVLAGRHIEWTSSDSSKAAVSGSGLVAAVAASRTAITITATSEGKSQAVQLNINPAPVASLEINDASPVIAIGETAELHATARDADGNEIADRTVSWSTANDGVVTVSPAGLLTGATLGRTKIIASCEGQSDTVEVEVTPVRVASITIAPETVTLEEDETLQLLTVVRDKSAAVLEDRVIEWTTLDATLATISPTGLVRALAVGTAKITATSDGKADTATVTVIPGAVATVRVTPSPAGVIAGQTVQLSTQLFDARGSALSGRTVTWATSNPAVATVSPAGVVSGVSVGSANITATSGDASSTVAVAVRPVPVASVTVSPDTATRFVGGTVQLTATPKDASNNTLPGRSVSWSSSNTAVVTVSQSGLVTGQGSGTATITATIEGVSDNAVVTVLQVPVASVTVTPAAATRAPGQTLQLAASPKDANGNSLNGRTVSWSSSDSAIATVSATGLVKAIAEGTATITATSEGKSGTATITVAELPVSEWATVARTGKWSSIDEWPLVAIHMSVLPDGQVLAWGRSPDHEHHTTTILWDPKSPNVTVDVLNPNTNLFCTGHAFLPDGRLLVSGGHIHGEDYGTPHTNIFNFATGTWTKGPDMQGARWYPTNTTLPNGEVLTVAGLSEPHNTILIPEIWTGSGWRSLTGASRWLPYHPWMFVAPNGQVFFAGPEKTKSIQHSTAYLSTDGSGSWTNVAQSNGPYRDLGSAVMYEPGKVLIAGGGGTRSFTPAPDAPQPTNSAEVIDLSEGAPQWRWTGSMAHPRREMNLTILPDGRVLVTGGTSSAGFFDPSGAVLQPEMWDPNTGNWSPMASMAERRMYHSTAVLLPDGRVLSAGGGAPSRTWEGDYDHKVPELYSPPYLFAPDGSPAERPTIASVSDETLGYGQQFTIQTANAPNIAEVTLVRLSSVTHKNNMNQRFDRLSIVARNSGSLTVKVPANANLAPPGHYMVFILNKRGVPSVAQIVKVG